MHFVGLPFIIKTRTERPKKGASFMYQKIKRILALLAVVLIFLLYLITFLLSLLKSEQAKELLMISLVATVVIPVLLYVYLWLFRIFHKRKKENICH